jgi:hypothetical protein
MAETRPREELYDLQADPTSCATWLPTPRTPPTLAEHRARWRTGSCAPTTGAARRKPEEVYLNYVGDERPEGRKARRATKPSKRTSS